MKNRMWQALNRFNNPSIRIIFFVLMLLLTVGIGIANWITGRYITLFLLYIFPVMFATWKVNLKAGFTLSVIASVMDYIQDINLKPEAQYTLLLTSTLMHFIFLCLIAYGGWKITLLIRDLDTMATKDSLTDILNHRGFIRFGKLEFKRISRASQPVSILYLDIDNFKRVNDFLGHQEGDKLLRDIADIIGSQIRETDTFGRLGGDEFAIILPNTDKKNARALGEKIHSIVAKIQFKKPMTISVSIGITTFFPPLPTLYRSIDAADRLMLKVKQAGKNAILQE